MCSRALTVRVGAWSLEVLESLHLWCSGFALTSWPRWCLVDNSVGEPPARKPDRLSQAAARGSCRHGRPSRARHFLQSPPEEVIEALKRSALKSPLADSVALLSYPQPREYCGARTARLRGRWRTSLRTLRGAGREACGAQSIAKRTSRCSNTRATRCSSTRRNVFNLGTG